MKINDKYKVLFKSKARYYIITGGRGSSKSFSVSVFLTLLTLAENVKILFTRFTMTSAHLSIIPEFIEKIGLLGLYPMFNINKSEVVNTKTGSDIIFRGLKTSQGDQTANLKSLQGVTTWVLDEAEELMSEDTFDKIDLSIRQKGTQNRIILIMNPATKEHWIYKKFFESKGVQQGFNGTVDDVCYIHTTYLDNLKNLSESYIKRLKEIKIDNPLKYKHKILGGWLDKAEGVVFENWKYGVFNPNNLQTSCGMDFGYSVDPDSLNEVAIDKTRKIIYVKNHIHEKGLKTHVLAAKIIAAIGNKLIIGDSAEPRLIADLKHKGVNLRPVKKGTIESGVNIMQGYEIIVDPSSTTIGKELNNYIYADKGSKLYVDDYNHDIDAIRYNVIYHLDNPNKGKYSTGTA